MYPDGGNLCTLTSGIYAQAAFLGLDAFVGEPATCGVGPVSRGPAQTAGQHRHPLTAEPAAAPQLRVVTYNLLADQYASSSRGKTKLFSYCPLKCGPSWRCIRVLWLQC